MPAAGTSAGLLSGRDGRCGQLAEKALGLGLFYRRAYIGDAVDGERPVQFLYGGPCVVSGTSVLVAGRPICRTAARKLSSAWIIRIRAGPPSARKVWGMPAGN